jgi:hypothetical protein
VTHPFHPWRGRAFVFIAVRQTWAEDRVFFLDDEGVQHSLPVGWTDAVGPDVFVAMAAERCSFRVADLVRPLADRFGVRVHPRSIERGLARRRSRQSAG